MLQHTFATHAATFGINPWTLNAWLGHKAMEETMRYVHVARHHRREVPAVISRAADGARDEEGKVLATLSARGEVEWRGNQVPTTITEAEEPKPIPLFI